MISQIEKCFAQQTIRSFPRPFFCPGFLARRSLSLSRTRLRISSWSLSSQMRAFFKLKRTSLWPLYDYDPATLSCKRFPSLFSLFSLSSLSSLSLLSLFSLLSPSSLSSLSSLSSFSLLSLYLFSLSLSLSLFSFSLISHLSLTYLSSLSLLFSLSSVSLIHFHIAKLIQFINKAMEEGLLVLDQKKHLDPNLASKTVSSLLSSLKASLRVAREALPLAVGMALATAGRFILSLRERS
jgi:hypothetical protein